MMGRDWGAGRVARAAIAAALTGGVAVGVGASAALAAGEPVSASPPTISSGSPVVGQTLQASHAAWSGRPTSYEDWWMRCDTTGNNCSIISGADGTAYTPTTADVGHTLGFGEIAYNSAGQSTPTYSSTTQPVLATPPRHFTLVGPTGTPQYALYIVEPAGRRPKARDWQRPTGHTAIVGQADADVNPGQTIYFSPTAMIGGRFGSVAHTLTPEGATGKAVHVTRATPSRVRVVLPRPAPAYHPGLSGNELYVLGQLNRKRRRLHEQPLKVSRILDQVASAAARDEAVRHRFPDPYLFSLAPSFGWPGDLTETAMAIIDAPLSHPAEVLAHWDGAYAGESTGLWDEIRSPFYTYVGIADGNGAWNLVLVGGCPAATDAARACGLTSITGR